MPSSRAPFRLASLSLLGFVAVILPAGADETARTGGVEAKAAYAKLKTMVGPWKAAITHEAASSDAGKSDSGHHPTEATVEFKLTGAGSALVETQFPGQPHEMVSIYHLDGDDLRMTHYCAAQNQPHLKLDRAHSTPEHLVFVFDGGTNFDPAKDDHIHALEITFRPDGRVSSAWEGYAGGKKSVTATFAMTRKP
jgi:hypothetical protein